MTTDIISLADARAAAQARETIQSIRAEFATHMNGGGDLAVAFEILTRLWAHTRDDPRDGGSRVGGTG